VLGVSSIVMLHNTVWVVSNTCMASPAHPHRADMRRQGKPTPAHMPCMKGGEGAGGLGGRGRGRGWVISQQEGGGVPTMPSCIVCNIHVLQTHSTTVCMTAKAAHFEQGSSRVSGCRCKGFAHARQQPLHMHFDTLLNRPCGRSPLPAEP